MTAPSPASPLTTSPSPLTPRITPEGEASKGKPGEMLIPDDPDERQTYALRIVAQRCLYGVDINPLAVEMAKLSLWLLTLAKDKPFEFLDHAIRCGDSLVGLHNLEQLRHYSLKPESDKAVLYGGPLDEEVAEAIQLRLQLESLPANTVEEVQHQEKLLKKANDQTAMLKYSADMLVAAEFWGESARDKAERVRHNAVRTTYYLDQCKKADEKANATVEFQSVAAKERRGQSMFHWPLEFPEVVVKRGGFDAFVGNPPFMGGQKITNAFTSNFRSFLVFAIAFDQSGSADLCTYFVLRVVSLLNIKGICGLITTNTIREGETRLVGLDQINKLSTSIIRAIGTQRWPGTAALNVSLIWMFKGSWNGSFILDDKEVRTISSALSSSAVELSRPEHLISNKSLAFKGTSLQGIGFLITPQEAEKIISDSPAYQDVLFPYLGGSDITRSIDASPSRWAINFFDWSLDQARRYPICLTIVEQKVKPEREKAAERNAIGARRAEYWWRYDAQARPLYDAIANLKSVWVIAQTSKYAAAARQSTSIMFDQKAVVFATESFGMFALLSSSIHNIWISFCGGTLGTTISYSVSDIFETLPLPESLLFDCGRISTCDKDHLDRLNTSGESLFKTRQEYMSCSNTGLTDFLNRVHDPKDLENDVIAYRSLLQSVDEAIFLDYGFPKSELSYGFFSTPDGVRFTISEPARREVLQRLLKLNHERYAEEVAQGLHDKKKPKQAATTGKRGPKKSSKQVSSEEPSLFGDDNEE